MGKRKDNIARYHAFESIYARSRKKRIPQDTEDKLLDAYTIFCDENQIEDVHSKDVRKLLLQYVGINKKLVHLVDPERFVMTDLAGSMAENIVDFERYLYEGALLLKLNSQLSLIDQFWNLVQDALPSHAHKECLYLKDIQTLCKTLNVSAPMNVLFDMLTVGNKGEHPWMNYLDFALILGRVGLLKDD